MAPRPKSQRIFHEKAVADALRNIGEGISNRREQGLNRKVSMIVARDQLLLGQIQDQMVEIFKKVPAAAPSGWALKKNKVKTQRELNLLLSDLHFGANLDGREVPLQYGFTEAARRLSAVILEAAEYKTQYREETGLNVSILGDIIQNQLHDMRDGNPLAEQVSEAMYLLCRAVHFLSQHFPWVKVRCTPGNHGRNTARHHDRATLNKWDATESGIYYALKMYCQNLKNVTVEIPRTPYITFKSFEHNIFMTHGDTVLSPGNPHKSLDVVGLTKRTNEINASAKTMADRYSLFAVGHVHFGAAMRLPTGPWFITNSCLIPTDAYGVSLGSLNSACGQWIWETVPGHVMGHHYLVEVDESTDKDKALDKIIAPFDGF